MKFIGRYILQALQSLPVSRQVMTLLVIMILDINAHGTIRTDSTSVDTIPATIGVKVDLEPDDVVVIVGDSASMTVTTSQTVQGPPVVGANDSLANKAFDGYDIWIERKTKFNPSPTRAVWLSALFPGLGQIYNRRYWKLPIVVGGFMGLGYATSWNNNMLNDYQRAYRDIMDSDPSTNSYMDFFPPTTSEADLDKTWLTNLLKSRKDFYRRNRDLCIIGMVGVYLLAMVDAYVDASLSHFDISPDLSMDVTPALIPDARSSLPGIGLSWAFNF
ncbi:MAG: hypothetical protein J6C44_02100 [Muribaculaceae bacterium]|nr:hypothetical protein [Muribaculaceae bacterium]